MTIRARYQVFCLVAILLVAGGACGSEDSPSVQGVEGGPGANATTPEDADTPDEVRAGVLEFSRAIAASPYFASTDWSLQRDFSQASVGATAIVRGEITGLDVGPLTSSQMDEVHDATGGTGSRTVSLAIQVSVVSTNSDQIPEGSDIDVLIPIWLGPDGFVSEAEESHVRPLLEFDPSGLEILVAVASFDETERTVNVIEFGGVVIGTSDGASSVVLASPSADGRAWGIADLKKIESSVVATAQ